MFLISQVCLFSRMCVASHVQAFYMYNVPVMFIVLYLSHILISLWLTSVQEPIMIGSCFSVNFFFILDAKAWGKIPSGTERWCWSACMSFSTTKLETNKSHWRRDWQCMVVSKTKIYMTTEDTYQWFISAQKQVFIHVQYLAAFFIILTVIWILWSKQSQFPLAI